MNKYYISYTNSADKIKTKEITAINMDEAIKKLVDMLNYEPIWYYVGYA